MELSPPDVLGRVRIDVTDNGVGVPPDQRALVFERFHRAHASDPRFSGTGLGLALCRTVVERPGGVIERLGTPSGVGTNIRFQLPCAEARPPFAEATPASAVRSGTS